MTRKEFEKLKVGDKVLVKNNHYVWWLPVMDCFDNKVFTIKEIHNSYIILALNGLSCAFDYKSIVRKIEEETIVIKTDGSTVTAYKGKDKAVAKCSPEDKFDLYTGAKLALDRLFDKEEKPEEKPKFEVGDIVIAITENYALTKRSNKWVGIVVIVDNNGYFVAKTICGVGGKSENYYSLWFEDFKKLDKTDYEKLF